MRRLHYLQLTNYLAKKVAVVKPLAPPPGEKKATGKMSLPTKAGNAGAKMNVTDKVSD